jgi:hypothetical protein
MLQEMVRVDDGKFVVSEGPGKLIEVVDDINSGKSNPIDTDAT